MGTMEIEGRSMAANDTLKLVGINVVGPEFFPLVGLPIKRGRAFSATSDDEIMVNELFARRFWPNGDAIGARIRRGSAGHWATVVGIVGDVRVPAVNSSRGKDLQIYQPPTQPEMLTTLVVRSDLPLVKLVPELTRAVHDADPSIELVKPRSASEMVAHSTDMQRFILMLLGGFAFLAVLLAVIGLHAVIVYSVSQRTREIGVRVALGAQRGDVVRLIIGQGLALAVGGVAIGVVGAVAATRALRALLYDVRPGDPLTVVTVSSLLLAIATAATYLPARHAARLDPVDALRTE
jgi:putative ABC transport system permease protein